MFRFPFNWYNKFGTIPSSYREAMSYEEQILWLCEQVKNIKEGSANYNYNLLENKPMINGITLQGNITSSQLGIDSNYNSLMNKPSINGTMLLGNKSLDDFGIQGKLVAGSGIRIVGNTISATGGGSGGTSDYDDLENKPTINNVTLQGDLTLRDLNIQPKIETSLDSEVIAGKVVAISQYQEGAVIPKPYEIVNFENASYAIIEVENGTRLDIYGKYDLFKINENNVLELKHYVSEVDNTYFESSSKGIVILNFYDTDTYTLSIKKSFTGNDYEETINDLKNADKALDNRLNLLFNANFDYEEIPHSSFVNGYFLMNKINIGEELLSPWQEANYYYVKIPLFEGTGATRKKIYYNTIFKIKGKMADNSMFFATKLQNDTEYIVEASNSNIELTSLTDIEFNVPEEADYIYFQFSNTNTLDYVLQLQRIDKIVNPSEITKISNPLVLSAGTAPSLSTGLYVLDADVFIGTATPANLVFGSGEIIYYDSTTSTFYGNFNLVALESGTWNIYQNGILENTLSNSRNKIPTSQAVYKALSGAGSAFYQTLDSNTLVFNQDGTTTPQLADDTYYFIKSLQITYYYNDTARTTILPIDSLCFYSSSKQLIISSVNKDTTLIKARLRFVTSLGWELLEYHTNNLVLRDNIASSITASSTNNQVAGAKAVYDLKNDVKLIETHVDNNPSVNWNGWNGSIIPLSRVTTNVGSNFTLANNKITINSSGLYAFTIYCQQKPTNNDEDFALYLNSDKIGSLYFNNGQTSTTIILEMSKTVYKVANAGDEVSIMLRGNPTSGSISFLNETGIAIQKLSDSVS